VHIACVLCESFSLTLRTTRPGWDRYPQIKAELKPVVADDGIFYLTKEEFFQYYGTIYLSASNMTEFLED